MAKQYPIYLGGKFVTRKNKIRIVCDRDRISIHRNTICARITQADIEAQQKNPRCF